MSFMKREIKKQAKGQEKVTSKRKKKKINNKCNRHKDDLDVGTNRSLTITINLSKRKIIYRMVNVPKSSLLEILEKKMHI